MRVNCKEDAGNLNETVPYAIAITLEVALPLAESIYEQIAERITPRIAVMPTTN